MVAANTKVKHEAGIIVLYILLLLLLVESRESRNNLAKRPPPLDVYNASNKQQTLLKQVLEIVRRTVTELLNIVLVCHSEPVNAGYKANEKSRIDLGADATYPFLSIFQ